MSYAQYIRIDDALVFSAEASERKIKIVIEILELKKHCYGEKRGFDLNYLDFFYINSVPWLIAQFHLAFPLVK